MAGRVQAGGNGDRDLKAVPEIERVVWVCMNVGDRAEDTIPVRVTRAGCSRERRPDDDGGSCQEWEQHQNKENPQ